MAKRDFAHYRQAHALDCVGHRTFRTNQSHYAPSRGDIDMGKCFCTSVRGKPIAMTDSNLETSKGPSNLDIMQQDVDGSQSLIESLSKRNRELESFAYSVSHDLREPLNVVAGLACILQNRHVDRLDQEGRYCVEHIERGVEKLGGIIDDILVLSGIGTERLQPTSIDLSAMVQTCLNEYRTRSHGRCKEVHVQEELRAHADPGLMERALDNMLFNAWKFTSTVARPCIEFGATATESGKAFFIRDNGTGFPQEKADMVFRPFQRLHTENELTGNGLGLSIAQRAIELQGGRIWAESEPGKGATFYFTLPHSDTEQDQGQP